MIGGTFTITYPQAYGYLVYNPALPLPQIYVPTFSPIDDFGLVPYDNAPILTPAATTITINMIFDNDDYNINR
jgi:iron transport multicopper oxidase